MGYSWQGCNDDEIGALLRSESSALSRLPLALHRLLQL
jgi:hypothetical protein